MDTAKFGAPQGQGLDPAVMRHAVEFGLRMTVVLFVGGFLDIGGEWFQMWRSANWNGSEVAFRSAVLALFALLAIHHPGIETVPASQ